jgi:hypothetical protein
LRLSIWRNRRAGLTFSIRIPTFAVLHGNFGLCRTWGIAMSGSKPETHAADQRRFKLIPLESLTPEQRVLADAIRSGPRAAMKSSAASRPGPLGGPFNVWLRSPGMGNTIQQLGQAQAMFLCDR